MAPRTSKRLQERAWDTPTKGLMWRLDHEGLENEEAGSRMVVQPPEERFRERRRPPERLDSLTINTFGQQCQHCQHADESSGG